MKSIGSGEVRSLIVASVSTGRRRYDPPFAERLSVGATFGGRPNQVTEGPNTPGGCDQFGCDMGPLGTS